MRTKFVPNDYLVVRKRLVETWRLASGDRVLWTSVMNRPAACRSVEVEVSGSRCHLCQSVLVAVTGAIVVWYFIMSSCSCMVNSCHPLAVAVNFVNCSPKSLSSIPSIISRNV